MSILETFTGVFQELQFPYLAVDLGRLATGLRDHFGRSTHIAVPLEDFPTLRRDALVASLRGVFRSIDPPIEVVRFISDSEWLQQQELSERFIAMAESAGAFLISEQDGHLVWEEQSLWPFAYSAIFQQFCGLVRLHAQATVNRANDIPNVATISEYPRQLPTHQHYAFASLGAWLGGAINVQYFGFYATQPQIRERSLNDSYAARIRYDARTAEALTASGMIVVPASLMLPLLEAQGDSGIPILGSIPIDEVSVANPPAPSYWTWRDHSEPLLGFLVDKHYRAAFHARHLEPHAVYGAQDVLRDHYQDFYSTVTPSQFVRCKHYCAPVLDVASIDEMRSLVASIPIRHKEGLFFRGQTRLYTLKRDAGVSRLLFGESCSREPSLVTSAARQPAYDYDSVHFALRLFVQELTLKAAHTLPHVESLWDDKSTSPLCELDYAIMALAQHYGLPSHGLDVTTSLETAVWFATHRFSRTPDGIAHYEQMTSAEWPVTTDEWPVVVVCQPVTHSVGQSLHDCHELDEFGIKALRPSRQSARFFLGGHSDHQNRLAETVVCVLRLKPGTYRTGLTFEQLFPSPADDAAYQAMLQFSEIEPLRPLGTEAVNRFHA